MHPRAARDPRARKFHWRRLPRGPVEVDVPVDPQILASGVPLPDFPELILTGVVEKVAAPCFPNGARALSLFLVNRRQPAPQGREDEAYIFQVELEIANAKGFIPRPNLRGESADDRDERVADLQFRNQFEYVVGHGIAAEPVEKGGHVAAVRSTWLPTATVTRVKTRDDIKDVTVAMEDLAALPAAPYMTVVGYFNSLRELGGMRRLVEDEVLRRCQKIEERRPENFKGPHPWVANRDIRPEPVELTSRESTYMISKAKELLGRHHTDDQHVDVALASNMISVGVDIERLGLMVVAGQPQTTSEYIQASSRVGRDVKRPGLVVTVMNVHRPRDRSHYERFRTYHESFYRFVEATSVTPFSGPAIDRGLCGTLVALVRLGTPALTPPTAVRMLEALRETAGNAAVAAIADKARSQPRRGDAADGDRLGDEIHGRCKHLLDTWQKIVRRAAEGGGERVYSAYDVDCRNDQALLHTVLDADPAFMTEGEEDFSAATSMRDVEPSVHFWIERQRLGTKGPTHG